MFGKNPVSKSTRDQDGMSLHVVEGSPFYTIQGEGPHAGRPAVFLRLHGCPLRCYFCDTEFSGPNDPVMSTMHVISKIEHVAPSHCMLLVLTGGEPARQNLLPLTTAFHARGWRIQIETSGIMWQPAMELMDIVVSPKTPEIDGDVAAKATCFKYVIRAGEIDQDGLPLTNTQVQGGKPVRLARPTDYGATAPIYLSPQDEYNEVANAANREEVARQSLAHGYRAGLQIHKFLNLP